MQLPAISAPSGEDPNAITTVVAIDKDKNSQQALRWTVEHLLINKSRVTVIHVRLKSNAASYSVPAGFSVIEQSSEASREHAEQEAQQLFIPYRGFCARKGMQMNEVILEDTDVSKALIEYIHANNIQNIVVGNSSRNALTRKFRNADVPSSLVKSTPEYCAVYVIAKGKPITVRAAKNGPLNTPMPPRQSLSSMPGLDDSLRGSRGEGRRIQYPPSPQIERRSFERFSDGNKMMSRDRPAAGSRSSPRNYFLDSHDSSNRPPRLSDFGDSFSDDGSSRGRQSIDIPNSFEFSSSSMDGTGDGGSPPPGAYRDIESEMKRLKLELKQTMDMYSTACKEAITAKQKAKELNKWKQEEAQKYEELRSAEVAALAIAEMEKAKCKAALEAAEEAQRIAEREAQRRISAEQKARREQEEAKRAMDALSSSDARYRKYTIDEIEVATDRFADSRKIGEGGYGPVYKGSLDHTPVAIKVLRPDAAQGRKQFQQEVEVLSSIRHPNMVLLLGACPEYGCLVYEFMEFGSLEDRLFRRGNTPPIPWSIRFKIAAEIATSLLFLHQAKPEPLVHRDLKPANILLDRNFTSKISDVGLARLVPPSMADTVTQYRMTSTAGTFCYIDPEYQQTGMLGTKSDIYSLGIMLLQIVTAKSPMGLSHHVERAIERGTFQEMLDPSVPDWPVDEALAFAELALKCCELRRRDRPDLATVILPELNKLRDLGESYETTYGYSSSMTTSYNAMSSSTHSSGSSFGAPSSVASAGTFSNPQQRPRSLQGTPVHPNLRAPWMSTAD